MSSNTECSTGEYHNMQKLWCGSESGREIKVLMICTVCEATATYWLNSEDGNWKPPQKGHITFLEKSNEL